MKDHLDDISLFPSFHKCKFMENEELEEPELHQELLDMVYELLKYFDAIELSIANEKQESIINGLPLNRGAVLIFAPGNHFEKKSFI